jgi:RNA polymerase-binding transcription factor DksA
MEDSEKLKLLLAHMSRDELNDLTPVEQPHVESEDEHFYVCQDCGQAVDYRRLGDVLHHEEPGHGPLPVN